MSKNLVQYIILRGDLLKTWKVGPMIAQACHGVTAVMAKHYSDPYVQEYLQDLDNMHKVVLEAPDLPCIEKLVSVLKENNIDHTVWIEKPENFCTCLVLKPYPKAEVEEYVKEFKLCSRKIK
ncbi:hypothetical protein R5R35_010267 [Gryllus longicercus]|uniref:peptidyl-tRNA hydrolase n=1 Tax=Gryllus longicercus TaxID=2509291 RepID=A0AAN9V0N2_9ORTH